MEYAIVFLPLLGSIIAGFFGRFLGDRSTQIITSLFVSISAVFSIIIFFTILTSQSFIHHEIFTWINSGKMIVNWSIKIDSLT